MLFYRYVYDKLIPDQKLTFLVSPPLPSPLAVLRAIHLPHKNAILEVEYKKQSIVKLDTSQASDFPPAFPLDLEIATCQSLLLKLTNTDTVDQTLYVCFCWQTKFP